MQRDEEIGEEFVRVSIRVYDMNDKRFEFKKKINEVFSSEIVEEKHYD